MKAIMVYVAMLMCVIPFPAFADDATVFPWAALITTGGAILVALLGWAFKLLRDYLKANVQNEVVADWLYRLDAVAETVVKDYLQSRVDDLKAAAKDGKIDEAERETLKQGAIDDVKAIVGIKSIEKMAKILGTNETGTDKLIGSLIEEKVYRTKLVRRK